MPVPLVSIIAFFQRDPKFLFMFKLLLGDFTICHKNILASLQIATLWLIFPFHTSLRSPRSKLGKMTPESLSWERGVVGTLTMIQIFGNMWGTSWWLNKVYKAFALRVHLHLNVGMVTPKTSPQKLHKILPQILTVKILLKRMNVEV